MSENPDDDVLDQIFQVLQERKANPTGKSYTATLFEKGDSKICEKISEEAGELVEAALETENPSTDHLIHETADLFFHTFVLLVNRGLNLDSIRDELKRRFGVSGLEEKASRSK